MHVRRATRRHTGWPGRPHNGCEGQRRRQRGQVAVEMVLLTPLLLTLFFLIFELGRTFGVWLIITNGAREGARYGIVLDFNATSDPAIQQRVQEAASFLTVNAGPCGASDSCIEVTRATAGTEKLVTVRVGYRVYTLMPITTTIPFLGPINYPGYFDLASLTTMRWE